MSPSGCETWTSTAGETRRLQAFEIATTERWWENQMGWQGIMWEVLARVITSRRQSQSRRGNDAWSKQKLSLRALLWTEIQAVGHVQRMMQVKKGLHGGEELDARRKQMENRNHPSVLELMTLWWRQQGRQVRTSCVRAYKNVYLNYSDLFPLPVPWKNSRDDACDVQLPLLPWGRRLHIMLRFSSSSLEELDYIHLFRHTTVGFILEWRSW